MTAHVIEWVTRGTPKTEEQQEAGGNGTVRTLETRRTRGDGACVTAEGKMQLGALGTDERIILKRVLKK